ncbi:hypothetical protein ACF0H5_010754 [Mactra antiquata]
MLHTLFNLSDSQQTQDHLKQMMVSLTTLDENKDALLKALNTAKKEAIKLIETFQNALHAVLRKAAESSKQEVEEAYNNLEKEIMQEKQSLTKTNDVLQDTDKKLDKTVANRAQRFVRTIIAKKSIKAAEQIKQKMDDKKDGILMFKPNKSLIKSIKSLQGVGNVQIIKKKKHDLYKLRGSKDINMKVTDDSKDCDCCDCCITKHITINESGNKMLVADWNNGLVCFDAEGSYLTTVNDNALRNVYGACVDNRGNIFVTSVNSHNVIQYTEDGNKIGVVVKQTDGINCPMSVCYHQVLNRLFVIKFKSNVLKMYEIE